MVLSAAQYSEDQYSDKETFEAIVKQQKELLKRLYALFEIQVEADSLERPSYKDIQKIIRWKKGELKTVPKVIAHTSPERVSALNQLADIIRSFEHILDFVISQYGTKPRRSGDSIISHLMGSVEAVFYIFKQASDKEVGRQLTTKEQKTFRELSEIGDLFQREFGKSVVAQMIVAIMLLHDVIEDDPQEIFKVNSDDKPGTTRFKKARPIIHTLLRESGFGGPMKPIRDIILENLDNLTKRDNEELEVYIERVKGSILSIVGKLGDFIDNGKTAHTIKQREKKTPLYFEKIFEPTFPSMKLLIDPETYKQIQAENPHLWEKIEAVFTETRDQVRGTIDPSNSSRLH